MNKFIWIALVAWDLCVGGSLLKWDAHLQVHVLDIGQGDAILVTTPEQNHVLVDGSPDSKVLSELGAVLPFFFRDIDLMVLTHPHADHVNGLIPVLQRFHVGAILMSAPAYPSEAFDAFLREVAAQGIPVYMAEAATDFALGDTTLDVLFPFSPATGEVFENVNNASVVMKVTQGPWRVLLTGDAEKEVEAQLLAAGLDLEADVLKAGHHGSHSSSTEAFLEEVAPRLMLISCGTGNTYGHPHRETLEKAAALGILVLRTDTDGRLDIVFGDYSWLRSIFAPSWRSFSSSRS